MIRFRFSAVVVVVSLALVGPTAYRQLGTGEADPIGLAVRLMLTLLVVAAAAGWLESLLEHYHEVNALRPPDSDRSAPGDE